MSCKRSIQIDIADNGYTIECEERSRPMGAMGSMPEHDEDETFFVATTKEEALKIVGAKMDEYAKEGDHAGEDSEEE